jgi:carbon-monoxide dehydrogenase small subunit
VIDFKVNGKSVSVDAPAMTRLLDVLREELKLTGTKEGCGEGECGACSVLVDGRLVNSCLIPVLQARGTHIETVESLERGHTLHAVQQGFLERGGAQCGICTPGMLLASVALLKKNSSPSENEIREGLAGNLCRCTGYMKIFDSVKRAGEILRGEAQP